MHCQPAQRAGSAANTRTWPRQDSTLYPLSYGADVLRFGRIVPGRRALVRLSLPDSRRVSCRGAVSDVSGRNQTRMNPVSCSSLPRARWRARLSSYWEELVAQVPLGICELRCRSPFREQSLTVAIMGKHLSCSVERLSAKEVDEEVCRCRSKNGPFCP